MPNFSAQPKVFASGFEAPEGPSFSRDGHLFFVDFEAGRIYRASPNGQVELIDEGGRPVGTKFHRDGRLFVCDAVRGLLTVDAEWNVSVLANEYEGKSLKGPNDLTITSQGDVYFTDPGHSNLENPDGDLYLYRADGTLERVDSGFAFCNGVAIGPDEKHLYLAETWTRRIHRYTLAENGRLENRTVFAELEGGLGPDGLAFDCEGNLYAAHWGQGCVEVLAPSGRLLGKLPTIGSNPTNVAFWENALYVTEVEKGQILRLDVGVAGLKVFGLG
jgi:gluconolactonase